MQVMDVIIIHFVIKTDDIAYTVWRARVLGDFTLVDLMQVRIVVKTYGTNRFVRLEFPYKTV